MKKVITVILTAVILAAVPSVVFASNGDIAGTIYSTDIKACINGVWVDSYNIGGRTAVVVEDITSQYMYSDALRTLIIDDLSPENLVTGGKSYSQKPGVPVGKIYETDIKTYFRGKQLTSYSLNGKMAVVIEELGADSNVNFSEIGGRYTWNAENRTISLECVYRYPYSLRNILSEKRLNMRIKGENGLLWAEFVNTIYNHGNIVHEVEKSDNSMYVVLYNDGNNKPEIIGYLCSFPEMKFENGTVVTQQSSVDYFYMDKLSDILSGIKSAPMTYEDWMRYYEYYGYSIIEELETDDYHFLYMGIGLPSGGTQCLKKVNKKDGTVVDYSERFESISANGGKRFENVSIDSENEKVYFHYDFDYVIDLKTDDVKQYNNLATDIGTGTDNGEVSEYYTTCAKNGQREYKLISGEEELTVNAFFSPQYYYNHMLPLKETFDFLNIKYTFEKDVLTIDTSEAKEFSFEQSEKAVDFLGNEPIKYLYVEKVVLDGEETQITYEYTGGHFENTNTGRTTAEPYVCGGKVYINDSFIRLLCDKETAQ